jgi:3'-phosphoadenosine 5'-phosphosulfate sulfotransferase
LLLDAPAVKVRNAKLTNRRNRFNLIKASVKIKIFYSELQGRDKTNILPLTTSDNNNQGNRSMDFCKNML